MKGKDDKPLNLLAIDASTEMCSVALLKGQDLFEKKVLSPKQHTALILPFIDELLHEAVLDLSQIDAIAFGAGPGSFTGLRIAASVTQGIAYARSLPVIALSTLAALAFQAVKKYGAQYIIPVLDARMGQIYWGMYQWDDQAGLSVIQSDALSRPEELKSFCHRRFDKNSCVGIGKGFASYSDVLQDGLFSKTYSDDYPLAADMAILAVKEYQLGHGLTAEKARPIYLREQVVCCGEKDRGSRIE